MSIAEDLKIKLKSNQCTIFITDADDLLAVWQFRRKNTFNRSVDFTRAPESWRCSTPPDDKSPVTPCHVSTSFKSGKLFSTIKPALEYSTSACHGYGRASTISVSDLDSLDAVTFAKRNVAPYVSPILDTGTLALVCKDLGIAGRAIPKVIKGRQHIAFSGHPGLRTLFPGTIYSANNCKIIRMAIGTLGIKNMVKTGGILTICITVPLTMLEVFLKDQYSLSQLAGNLASDLIKIGTAQIMGAIFGIMAGVVTAIPVVSIGVAIAVSVGTGFVLNALDSNHKLTEKLITSLEGMGEKIKKLENSADRAIYRGMDGFLSSQGLKLPRY